ncbi:MAG: hypothetical protein CO042_02095 [Parcubacteria group bacterium CG_4_9_14_0_2_um_filter_41_8]|nr:MAG: hypothetical protein COV79_01755 [Parcubacteria group bacterium CG11_big_fil_rev_8_21_14_0_20_41_14]PIR56624.1 MAG: hypothetical protein COU72_05265 [Parcubacteria group bacterium CG10_big_fil_rev_8_21_14_0_10_41_35]PIZ81865.1 MAG: hypothetical protein COY02_00940 [Parcubacteria group bacterium CG_4_10_14_0_2_um_filter_41_6]PJC40761.1 MAG: hypothetical protein CO042_02095 [Parcubacteria group bacterium CG_4_9_14_0_2_um_filter_41_8]
MIIIKEKISKDRLNQFAKEIFGDMIKIVVDLERKIMAVGGEMHADCEQVLLDNGSKQENLWGANIYPDSEGDNFIEYQSLINIRPKVGNRSMEIQNEKIRKQVREVINLLIE